jgi:hypothetical protein
MIDLLRPISQLATATFVVVAALSHAQTAPLNDTGQTSCYDASDVAVACDAATAGNTGTRPHQDGRYGRDAAAAAGALSKVGGGAAGFDFSCVLWNGTVISGPNCHVGLVANTSGAPSTTPTTDWACTKDNVTNLIWSLQIQGPTDWTTATGATYANAGHNSVTRCGFPSGWRVPTRRELLGIVHFGASAHAIDGAYFPQTAVNLFWTANGSLNGRFAWFVGFDLRESDFDDRSSAMNVRLVRSGL